MRKVMLLAAMLAMVLAAAAPAFAQSFTQSGDGNVACIQTAVQVEVGKTQTNQYGDNINVQNIAQECNVSVAQVEEVLVAAPSASASATASAAAVQYQYDSPAAVQYEAPIELPETGGASLLALGAGALLVGGGLLARRIVR
ncbi:MAG TPA: LPXTG cell wall anchor domain-containing protein [Rubrobacter sp.]|nr:LPXTG cell wall anchor domain-containing protein [Rubrobacter sp.]